MGEKTMSIKRSAAAIYVFMILCLTTLPVQASELNKNKEECIIINSFESTSCWNCGNNGFYTTTENNGWRMLSKLPCVHDSGYLYDIVEITDIVNVTKCTYCQYVAEQTWIRSETREKCSNE